MLLALAGCGPATEEAAFEDAVASMSIEKTADFLARYPDGPRADELLRHLQAWCRDEPSRELREAAAAVLPATDPRSAALRLRCAPIETGAAG